MQVLNLLLLMGNLDSSTLNSGTMQFIFAVFLVLVCCLFAIFAIRLQQWSHQSWVKGNPPVDYLQASQANRDPWRWRQPHPRKTQIPYESSRPLGIKDAPDVSHFLFPTAFPLESRGLSYSFMHLWGVLLMGFGVLILLSPTGDDLGGRLLFCLFLCSCGLLLLQVGPVVQIDLYPHRIEIVTQSAFAWRRTTVYKREQILRISGRVQSPWAKIKGQFYPDYKLTIVRSLTQSIPGSQTYSLVCNPTTGSWVVGGLNHWKSLSI